MTYNVLDIARLAKELQEQLVLEQRDIASSLSYEYATTRCDDCPQCPHEPRSYSEQEFGIHYAPTCCKEDEQWSQDHEGEFQKQQIIDSLIKAISRYLEKSAAP